jgi:conjugal transfer pilus assembly protein TraW
MHIARAVACLFLCVYAFASAEDLGTKAPVFSVDQDGRDQLKALAKQKVEQGSFEAYKQEFIKRNVDAIKHPAPLGIKTGYGHRIEMKDARYVMPSDVKDQEGRIVARRGTVIEPLKINPLQAGMIFIDGRDEAQVQYALKAYRAMPLKIVLVAGSAFDLRVRFKDLVVNGSRTVPFYFDQRAMIIKQLNSLYKIDINSVPALVTQAGDKVRLEFGMVN